MEPLLSASRAAGRGVKQHGSRKPKWRGEQRPPQIDQESYNILWALFFFLLRSKSRRAPVGGWGNALFWSEASITPNKLQRRRRRLGPTCAPSARSLCRFDSVGHQVGRT